MKPTSRRSSTSDCFYRYLKPGALAQLRNSKISARSHKPISIISIAHDPVGDSSLLSSHHHQISMGDQVVVPCLVSKIYGPKCLKRKKLMATRSVFFLNLESANVINNDTSITVFNNDSLVAH